MQVRFWQKFSNDVGIDLGTSNTRVYVRDKGITVNEPSVLAINTKNSQILAVGEEARKMFGKAPAHILTVQPLIGGVISDFEAAEKLVKYFLDKVALGAWGWARRPLVVIGIPLDVTEVERKAVQDAVLRAGARDVFLVEEPMAAAIGARLPVEESIGNFVVDIGGGTTDMAIVSLGGLVVWKSIRIAGDEMNDQVVQYVRENFNLIIGPRTAEDIKIKIGSAYPSREAVDMKIRGRDLLTGLPREMVINDGQVREALRKSLKLITDTIKATIEITPPEMSSDIYERGIVLTGGGALLKHLDILISKEVLVPVSVTDDPLTTVVRGTGIIVENEELLAKVAVHHDE